MRLKLFSKFLIAALNESKKNFLAKQFKLTPEEVENISKYDPSPNNAYTAWLCRVYKDMGAEGAGQLSKYTEPLKKFMKLMNSPDFSKDKRDIGKYTANDLMDLVGNERRMRHNLSEREVERRIMNEGLPGAKMVWNSDGFKMWHVTNAKYARFLSSNTSWCTAQPDYSTRYCNGGGLFPIYYLGKPFAQGYIEHKGTSVEFLDVKDNPVAWGDPLVLTMFDVIKLPQMAAFCRGKLAKDHIAGIVENMDSDNIPKLQKLLIDTDNIPGIQGFVSASEAPVWEDGIEILLDYPQILLKAFRDMDFSKVKKIKNEFPELAHDVALEITEDASKNDSNIGLMMNLMGDEYGIKFVPGMVRSAIERGTSLPDVILHNPAFLAEVGKVALAHVAGMENYDGDTYDFFNYNKEVKELKDAAFAFWKKYINRAWPSLKDMLSQFPEYTERCESLKSMPKRLRVGQKVTVGPDYTGSLPEGVEGKIEDIEGDLVTVSSEDPEFDNKVFNFDWDRGVFQLKPWLPKNTKWTVMDPLPEKLKVGDMVTLGPDWRDSDYSRQPGDLGEVIREKRGDEGQLVYIRFQSTPEVESGGYYYIPESTKRVVPVTAEVSTPKIDLPDLPQNLPVGTRVKRGPTWHWNNQDRGGPGVVDAEPDHDGWTGVLWDEGSDNRYRYGVIHNAVDRLTPDGFGPFYLDLIPEDMESLTDEEARVLSWTMAGEEAPPGDGMPI